MWDSVSLRTVVVYKDGRPTEDRTEPRLGTTSIEFTADGTVSGLGSYTYRDSKITIRSQVGTTELLVTNLTDQQLVYKTHYDTSNESVDNTFTYKRR